ncbi:MAG: CBS domain-containing protein [Bacteroidaceae bacterium]|nr:CBS domain-containing protein [Bacteroidaceae bacterium]
MPTPVVCSLAAVSVLSLFGMAFLAAVERGFTSLSAESARSLRHLSDKKRQRLAVLWAHPNRLRQAVMLYRSLLLAIYAAAGLAAAVSLWGYENLLAATATMAVLAIVVGGILPRRLAAAYATCIISRTATTALLLVKTAGLLTKRTGRLGNSGAEDPDTTLKNLERAIENYDTAGSQGEKEILKSILRFGDETAGDLMTPRARVFALDDKAGFAEVLRKVEEENYSRIPVYEGSPDRVRGILYIKDLLPHLDKPDTFEWQRLVRQPFFIPENKTIRDLLREFKKSRVHIAVVVDEYGAMAGVVTMEDIWEEIFGDIQDEFDEEKQHFIRLAEDDYIVEGETSLADFCDFFNLDEDEVAHRSGEADTAAGLVLALLDGFPELHDTAKAYGLEIEVLQVENRRISKLRVKRSSQQADDAD